MKFPEAINIRASRQLPELDSFVKSDKERKLLALHRTFRLAGSPFILPPGTPKDRAEILREAMRKIYADREFLAEYLKLTGEEASPLFPTPTTRRSENCRAILK